MLKKRDVTIKIKNLDIPEDMIAEYREAFDLFDLDKNGLISPYEIQKIMKDLGNKLSMSEVEEIFRKFDANGDGLISFEEFVTMIHTHNFSVEESNEDSVLKAFKLFDDKNTGKITTETFRIILIKLGKMFNEDEVNKFFKICKIDDQDFVDYRKFINFWKEYKIMKKIKKEESKYMTYTL
jgi:Ca2+-binding EF-hand superfamily protein